MRIEINLQGLPDSTLYNGNGRLIGKFNQLNDTIAEWPILIRHLYPVIIVAGQRACIADTKFSYY